ncbi:uncharacterized protein METZ01_LOCUS511772, partial [marine metagenome]
MSDKAKCFDCLNEVLTTSGFQRTAS